VGVHRRDQARDRGIDLPRVAARRAVEIEVAADGPCR
jgi:hypothetical protein